MKQLLIPLSPPTEPTLANFVAGDNLELVQALMNLCDRKQAERMLYLWGEPGSGKSHLLRACVSRALDSGLSAEYLEPGSGFGPQLRQLDLVAIDDVDRLDPDSQIELFYLYNHLRESGGMLLASGSAPPSELALRPDLVTRLGWGLVYQIHLLGDRDKQTALQYHSKNRGFDIPNEVINYLMHHGKRDLPTLMRVVSALDRHSLETKRPITVPMLKEIMQISNEG